MQNNTSVITFSQTFSFVLRNYNTILLEQLQKRYANWFPYQKIGDVFRKMVIPLLNNAEESFATALTCSSLL